MSSFTEKYPPDQLPPEEFSEREKQLMNTHLNMERKARWRKLAGPKPMSLQAILEKKLWVWWVVAILFGAMICWKAGLFSTNEKSENSPMAARADLIEYAFNNNVVRGEQNAKGLARPAKALEAYRKNDFETALREATPSDHFFVGVCLLQLKEASKALAEFDQVPTKNEAVGDEFFYYKGVTLQDLGRGEEAKQFFRQVLESKTVREPFRSESTRRMKN